MQTNGILWRIDDRLIHGQVIIGWCGHLPIVRLVICDNQIAVTDWEKELLLMAAPANIDTEICTTDETALKLNEWQQSKGITMILCKTPLIIRDLVETGVMIGRVNVGGIHFREGRNEYLSYLYLTPEEVAIFQELMEQGILFECQDLPTSATYNLRKILEKKHD